MKRTVYQAFGLHIDSEIELAELVAASNSVPTIDVEIRYADLNKQWEELGYPDSQYVVSNDGVYFQIEDAGIFLVQEGKRILVSPFKDSDPNKVRLYLLGSCMGTILMQRSILPLHGSAIVIDGKAYAIVGDSGAGKSTLASAFLASGFHMLTDDVIAVYESSSGSVEVAPAYPQQKLWQESLTYMEMDSNQYSPLFNEGTKFAIPVSAQFHGQSMPLAGIFELVKTDGEAKPIQRIQGLPCLPLLSYHTYRNFLIGPLQLAQWHFSRINRIINQAKIYRIERSTNHGFTANQLVDQILHTIRREE